MALVEAGDEMLGQGGHIVQALAQRRQLQRQHIEAKQQVLAEFVARHQLRQRPAAGRDHPYIGALQLIGTDRPVLALLQKAQELDLGRQRQAVDIVQEQAAAFGLAHQAVAVGMGGGERAPHMAEQLAFDQLAVQGTAVDRHPGACGTRRQVVQSLGKDFLAGAGFTEQQHTGIASGKGGQPGHLVQEHGIAADEMTQTGINAGRLRRGVPSLGQLWTWVHGTQSMAGVRSTTQEAQRSGAGGTSPIPRSSGWLSAASPALRMWPGRQALHFSGAWS